MKKQKSFKLNFILIVTLLFIVAFLQGVRFSSNRFTKVNVPLDTSKNFLEIKAPELIIGDESVELEIAFSEKEKILGLSGRDSLKTGKGMIFIFDFPDKYGFWMKDMKFPIDIAWLDNDFRIVHIESNVQPKSFPQIFVPNDSAIYVLELNANFFKNHEIFVDDILNFKNLI